MQLSWNDIALNAPLMILIAAVLIQILGESFFRGTSYFVALAGVAFAAIVAAGGLSGDGESFGGMMRHGGYANYFNLLFLTAAFMTAVSAHHFLEHAQYQRGEFYILLVFSVIGMMLIAGGNDLMILFLGIELMSLSLYVLAGFIRTNDKANEAALKYFLMGAFATGFLLYGIALIYGASGTTNFTVLRQEAPALLFNGLFLTGLALVLCGLAFKVAAAPFHMWAPDVYEGASTPVTAFMATAAKAAAFAGLITLFLRVFEFSGTRINEAIAVIAAASMILGNGFAIPQQNLKRMLAYSGIAHAGYFLTGIASATPEGKSGALLYLAGYACMNFGALTVISVIEQSHTDNSVQLETFAGLGKKNPFLAFFMSVFLFALAGIPPFAGFIGKYYVFLAAVKSGMLWLAVIGVLTSVLSAYYYLRVIVVMYFNDTEATDQAAASWPLRIILILCAAGTLLIGIAPARILQLVQQYFP